MSYSATVFKVFIASPSDVLEERKVIRKALQKESYFNISKPHLT